MKIQIRYTGRNYHLSDGFPEFLDVPQHSSTRQAIEQLRHQLGGEFDLPSSCLVMLDGEHLGNIGNHRDTELRDGSSLFLFAPVAGG